MRKLVALFILFLSGCSGAGTLNTGLGSVGRQDTFEMEGAYKAYYEAVKAQAAPIEIVKIEVDQNGKIKSFAVNQAPTRIDIPVPKKSYSPGWETANRFVDGLWGTAKFAVPGLAAWATADAIGKIADRPNVTNSYNSAGTNYAGGDYSAPVDNSLASSYNPTDNSLSDSQNPTDNSNQGNPVDNSDQGNPTDNSNQGNSTDNSVLNPAPVE